MVIIFKMIPTQIRSKFSPPIQIKDIPSGRL